MYQFQRYQSNTHQDTENRHIWSNLCNLQTKKSFSKRSLKKSQWTRIGLYLFQWLASSMKLIDFLIITSPVWKIMAISSRKKHLELYFYYMKGLFYGAKSLNVVDLMSTNIELRWNGPSHVKWALSTEAKKLLIPHGFLNKEISNFILLYSGHWVCDSQEMIFQWVKESHQLYKSIHVSSAAVSLLIFPSTSFCFQKWNFQIHLV